MIKSDSDLTKHVNDSYTFNTFTHTYTKQNIKRRIKAKRERELKKTFICSRLNRLCT